MSRLLLSAAAAAAATFSIVASPALAATESQTIHVGQLPTGTDPAYFFLTSGTPESSSITADFGDTISGESTTFDDSYVFTIPQDGMGSGSVSTSFSALSNMLTINQVLINGTSYTAAQAQAGVSDVPIMNGVMNTIEVLGETSSSNIAATYSGTATFAAVSAAPEPSTWLLMIGGIGLAGLTLRRRQDLGSYQAT